MENVIYNELCIRGYRTDVGAKKDKDGKVSHRELEVDFVCNLGSSRVSIQSAYFLPDEEKRMQEVRPFRKIDDSFKKIIITKDIVQQ
nr:ATP-binding protein [uncultured Sphaerochaeta sp.]